MGEASTAPRVTARAEEILARVAILENPYLQALASGDLSLEGFQRTQEQFFYAVEFFSRPMAGLVARIQRRVARASLGEASDLEAARAFLAEG